MYFNQVPAGKNIPEDIYVIIEIPANSDPIKYEIDKKTGIIFVDRFLLTPMFYPCNYGYINNTLSLDGDPVDVLVPTQYPLQSGCVILCRPIGMLNMIDESGEDAKIIAVPHEKISEQYSLVKDINDFSILLRNQISHFFKNYKELDSKKWVKIKGWSNINAAKTEILNSFERFKKKI
ncbi:inorganic diphosphatase [Blochmannia endosymbiont of Camponotus modoc]|uniref:inorganic diphosphatase n=1 Tax=Blochmannia endosymbiont of Camponotus modoc TaxID=2945587 RepID=UPI00202523AE|nr:inorganic diphosphatase [Blochmannia endosymbiont of Camponotus modoc]URJ26109.1 inorganic diphosphatase [Blochmannia endosymbiont of Camponotus modoc]URJ31853.1 inorganic diphosphatase [Blochmannia endosymbiont of Camponotus modoc]